MEIRDNGKDGGSPRWDISQERAFIENLLGQRFNFLLIVFSIFVAGAVNARSAPILQCLVLTLGSVIICLLMLTIRRSQEKLDILLKIIFQDKTHPAAVANDLAKGRSRRGLVGNVIPALCLWVMASWAAFSWINLTIQQLAIISN
jgi:hypothetical protein